MVYNENLKRHIPDGWDVKQIGKIIFEQDKSSIQVSQVTNTGLYPFFTSGNDILIHNDYIVDGMYCYLSTGGNASVKYYYGKASYSTDTWCISADNYSFYLYNYLNSIKSQMDKLYFAGTGLKHLQKDILKNSYIVVPPTNYMHKYNNFVSSGYKMVSDNYLENQNLTKLRDWLLPMLMNGQISVVAE
ncbi:MAG: restriction endonuclease subunit S [Sphaerochaetaceae bacterium]|nr:restriction endonuclease subunit S [Sphaerochaetaceae bacterium]